MSGRSKLCNFINDSHKGNLFPLDFIQNKAKIHILNMNIKKMKYLAINKLKNSQFLTSFMFILIN